MISRRGFVRVRMNAIILAVSILMNPIIQTDNIGRRGRLAWVKVELSMLAGHYEKS
jgi:hypothetical protein